MENKINILTKISINQNAQITDYQKTYQKRYGRKITKSAMIEMIIGYGLEKVMLQNEQLLNEIIEYQKI